MQMVAMEITRGLKEGKWISVEYQNQNLGKNTFFWIAIKDILPNKRLLVVDMFNFEKSNQVLDAKIHFDQIVSAQSIEGTTCERNLQLLKRIQDHYHEFAFLEYTGVNDRILNYYAECYYNDKDISVRQYTLVDGVDDEILLTRNLELSDDGFMQIVKDLQKFLRLRSSPAKQQILRLAMNELAVVTKNGFFPVVYRVVNLDVKQKKMICDDQLHFNIKISNNGHETSLHRYLDCNASIFMENFSAEREYFTQEIASNLVRGETIDERPYLFELKKHIGINIEVEYRQLQKQFAENHLTSSCQAFFGLNEKEKRTRKIKPIMVHNKAVNIDQYRVIQNAMNKQVVYVQGPPGTGKTATIVNTTLSALLNDFSVLLVSNNNEAVNNIYHKLLNFKYKQGSIHLPILRLGSNEYITYSLDRLYKQQSYFTNLIVPSDYPSRVKELEQTIIEHFSQVNQMIDDYDAATEAEEQIESLRDIIDKISASSEADETSRGLAIAGIKAQIQNIRMQTDQQVQPYETLSVDEELISEYLFLLSYQYHRRIHYQKNKELKNIILMTNVSERIKAFKNFLITSEGMTQLLDCFPVVISTNLSVTKLHNSIHFDLLIMDEASQCNNALALLPMMRSQRALFVGDQNQLQPVVVMNTIKNEELIHVYDIPVSYDYKNNSMLSTLLSVDTLSKFILLRNHYRCHEKIISFSNQKYYGNELKIETRLDNLDALKFIDVDSGHNEKNTSQEEIKAILHEIKKIPHKNVAVITPYRAQANQLSRQLEMNQLDYVKVGTIHTFQGDEKETIIISSGISKSSFQGSFDWIKNNQELINVATTRAKRNLILVGDSEQIHELSQQSKNDFLELMEYVKRNGEYTVDYKENKLFHSKVKAFKYYNTEAEEEFLKTLLHLKSVYQAFDVQTKVKVTDVLTLHGDNKKLFTYGNQAHFDFVLYDLNRRPLLVVEVIGNEHLQDLKVMERDKKKHEICRNEGIALITIRNDYVRRYQFIKDRILDALR